MESERKRKFSAISIVEGDLSKQMDSISQLCKEFDQMKMKQEEMENRWIEVFERGMDKILKKMEIMENKVHRVYQWIEEKEKKKEEEIQQIKDELEDMKEENRQIKNEEKKKDEKESKYDFYT